jgi:hypothetical protein
MANLRDKKAFIQYATSKKGTKVQVRVGGCRAGIFSKMGVRKANQKGAAVL